MARIEGTNGDDNRTGTGSADVFILKDGNDVASGGAGNDEMNGGAGNDTLHGNEGADTLSGGAGYDVLFGGSGSDVLIAGGGRDELWGGPGADTFRYPSATVDDQGASSQVVDIIEDFSRAQNDRIDLSGIDANWNVDGNQSFRFIGQEAHTGPGQLSYTTYQSGDNWYTAINAYTNGDNFPDFSLTLAGRYTLSSGDFIL